MVDYLSENMLDFVTQSPQGQNLKVAPRPEPPLVKSRSFNLARNSSSPLAVESHLPSDSCSDSITQTANIEPMVKINEGRQAQDGHRLPANNHPVQPRTLNGVGETTSGIASSIHIDSNRQQPAVPRHDDQADARVISISSHSDTSSGPRPSTPESSVSDHTFTDSEQCRDTVAARKTSKLLGHNQALRFLKGLSSIVKSGSTSSTELPAISNWTSVKTTVSTWLAKRIDVDNLQTKDTVIAVMGPTGAGKSSFINMVVTAGEEDRESAVTVGHTLQSCTSEIAMVELRDPTSDSRIVLVDTPGFDDTHKSDTEILAMVADWLERTYKKDVKLAGIIYMHRISDNRMAGTPLKNLELFYKLIGKHALKNVVLATTMWDEVEEEQGILREAELQRKYWKGMLDAGSKTFRYTRSQESAWNIAEHFIDPYVSYALQLYQAKTVVQHQQTRLPVQLQSELVDDKTPLRETQAGQKLLAHLDNAITRQQSTLKRLQKGTNHLSGKALSDLLAEFETQREEIHKLTDEAEALRLPFTHRVMRAFTSPLRRRS